VVALLKFEVQERKEEKRTQDNKREEKRCILLDEMR
jgi:hypothetical protein